MAKAPATGMGAMGQFTELRQRLMFVLLAIIVYRIGSFIPVPGVDAIKMAEDFNRTGAGEGILGMFNAFTGGSLERMSIFALGVMPYISASIIMQLLAAVVPSLQEAKKAGGQEAQIINKYTRYLTVILAIFQGMMTARGLIPDQIVPGGKTFEFMFTAVLSLVAGAMFLMWLGEQVTERGIGNGISILIFVGIVAGIPSALGRLVADDSIGNLAVLAVIFGLFAIFAFVVFVERGQRRITVNYARRQQGRRTFAQQSSFLPFKLNMAGVIPAIFASTLILFPATIAQLFFANSQGGTFGTIMAMMTPGSPLYAFVFGGLIIFFCFFYVALMYDSKDTADNLKRSGAFIPGIRPGEKTAEYVDGVLTRLTVWGSIYIAAVCLVPDFFMAALGAGTTAGILGGTSILIIVVVVMDFMAQLQSHMMSHQYEGLMKKANLRGKR